MIISPEQIDQEWSRAQLIENETNRLLSIGIEEEDEIQSEVFHNLSNECTWR